MDKSPTRFRVNASAEDMDSVKAKVAAAPPGSIVSVQFGNKTLEIVAGEGASAVVTVAQPSTKHPGGKPQETQANKLISALYEEYKTMKEGF